MGDEIIWIVLFFLTIPLFMFISCIAMWVRTNALKDDLREIRRHLDRLRQQLDAALKNKDDLRWGQNQPAAATQKERTEAGPMPISPDAHDFGVYNYTADTPTATPPQQQAPGGIPASAPIPPASPIPPATPTPRSSVPLSSPAPEVFDTDQSWEDEAPRRRPPTAQPQRATSETVAKTYDIPSSPPQPPASSGFEWQFGRRLPVWIGGVAIALSGFYLVKYTIEQGLLTREVRVFLGFIMGCILIYGARYIRLNKPKMADGTRIAQALAGSGVAVLYGTVYAATSLYHFLAPWQGFIGMAITTALAVVLALLHGMPIAVLGLLGGFLTPALLGSHDPNAPLLFFYLYCLVTGLFATIRRQNWWVLGVPTLLLAFAWVAFWLAGSFRAGDGLWLGLFIIATAVTVAWQSRGLEEEPEDKYSSAMTSNAYGDMLNYIVAGGSVVLMGTVATRSGFGLQELGLYGLLGLGTFVMAYFKPRLYHYAPWISMVVSLAMMAFWREPSSAIYAPTLLAFAALYGIGSFALLRKRPALEWAGMLSATALGFYGLAYVRLQSDIYGLLGVANTGALHLWGAIAVGLALCFSILTAEVMRNFKGDEALRQRLLAVSALTSTAFLSIALTIEVRREFLPVAFAAETLAVCWINTRVNIAALRKIAAILFGVFTVLMLEQLLVLFAVILNSLFGYVVPWRGGLPLAQDPMFQLGLPMVMIGLSAWLIQRQRDGRLAEVFEMATVALGVLLLYYMTRHVFNVPSDVLAVKPQFFERGVMTNLFFAAGLAVVYAGRLFSRRAILWSGTAIFLMALFRVIWFDFITQNPLFTGQPVGAQFFMNSLLLPYALPLFWMWLEERPQLRLMTVPQALRSGFTLLLLFTFISLQVRQCFHGSVLSSGATTNAEIYAYSVVWLGLGAFLLFLGTKRKDKMIRVASLVVMLLTIGKVFLYDAGNLEGLYRVASFLGLGLSLLALSWFYSRFVFVKEKE